jgi:hypothetical protein
MVKAGIIIGLLGIPGLIIPPVGLGMMGVGALLIVLGVVGNTAKAGVKAGAGVGKLAARSVAHGVTTKSCPDCRTDMPKAAVVCLACGYREPAAASVIAPVTLPADGSTPPA